MAVTSTQIQQLYVAYFARPADPVGLNFYIQSAATSTAAGVSDATILNSISTTFAASAEYTANFTGMSNAQIVNQVYQNLFSHAADASGLLYWAGKLTSGDLTVSNVVRAISTSAVGANNVDGVAFSSKVTAAESFTASLTTTEQIIGYSGTAAGVLAKAYITSVNSAATLATAIVPATLTSTVTSVVAAGNFVAGSTFTLTTGADSGTSFTGTAGNDTFNAVIGTSLGATDGTTLNPGDNINGGAGTDTLVLSISGTHAGAITDSAFTLSGIETLSISNFETSVNDTTLDLSLATAVATVNVNASTATGDTVLTNVKNIVAAQMQNGAGDLNIGYQASVVAGTADAQTLLVSAVTGGTFTANGVESLAITSSGSARNVLTAITNDASLKAVTVAGTAALTMGTLGAAITSLNASANSGGVTATLSATTTTAVTGSSGNDSFTSGTVLTTGSVNGGDGIDTLVATLDTVVATAALGLKYTGFETFSRLAVEGATGTTRTQDMSLLSGITTVNASLQDNVITGNEVTTSGVTFTNLAATTNTLNITALSTVESVAAAAGVELTANVVASRATNTLADALTINLGSATAASGATAIAGTVAAGDILLNVTVSNEESLTINSLFGANFITTLDDAALTSLTATGSKALTIGAIANNTLTTKIDASAMTADFIMGTNAGTTASTISGGTGADTLIGSTKADVITGGAGNDAITAGAGADNVSGGDGDDTITVSTLTDFTLALETVSGGAGNDTLSFTEAAVTTLTAAHLGAISGIEQISIANGNNAISVTLTDAVFTANGQALKIIDGDLTQGALTVDGSALTAANVLDVTANTTTLSDSLVGGAGADIFRFSTIAGLETGDTVTGGAGTDTIILAATAADVTAVLTNVRTVENITTTGTGFAINITVGASTMAASTTLTTNASAQSTSTGLLTYNGSAVVLTTVVQNVTGTGANDVIAGGSGNDIIVGGAGTDAITGGLGIDNLSGGDGVDTFTVATLGAGFVGLTTAETVNGGSGTDILTFAAGALAVASTDLLGLVSVETITIQNTTETASITLTDAVYTADGVTTLTVNNVLATSGALTLVAGSLSAANSVKVDISKTDNTATAAIALGAGNDTVTVDQVALDNTTTVITGGAGTDTLAIKANTGGAATTVVAGVTGFETVSFTTAAGTYNIVVNDANVASGITQTVDGSILTGTLLWDGTLELDGLYNITTGTGADSLTGGAKNDTISAGGGDDSITGALGADQLTGGAGADTFVYSLGAAFTTTQSNATLTDTITDWTSGTDKLQVTLNYGTFSSSLTVDATIQTARAGTSLIQDNLSGSRGQATYDTTGSALYINVNADNLLTTADFKININPASTATATLAEGDINFVITGGTNADTITAGGGADTITPGAGADSITGGNGVDTITMVTDGAVDSINIANVILAANRDVVTGFVTTSDQLVLGLANTTVGTVAGPAVATANTTAAGTGAVALGLTGATTGNCDVILMANVTAVGVNSGNLSLTTAAGLSGTELLKALTDATAADTYTGITAAAASQKVYIQALQGGVNYIYFASDANADSLIVASEIVLVGTVTTTAGGALVQADFAVA